MGFEIVGERETAAFLDACEPAKQHDTSGAERLEANGVFCPQQTTSRNAFRETDDLLSTHVEKPAFDQPHHR
ncbi:MAG: hypothetical protein E5V59_18500 [Mesorhizobium sp.]|nr:MAG: hypothetical protein E5V59_18500 [Mesorhizobium sp.]